MTGVQTCALPISEYLELYLHRSIKGHYEIPKEEFDSLWNEGAKALRAIINQDKDPSRQIRARFDLIDYFILKKMWDEAEEIAEELPELYGINLKGDALKIIATAKFDYPRANEIQEKLSFNGTVRFLDELWERARSISIFGNVRSERAHV